MNAGEREICRQSWRVGRGIDFATCMVTLLWVGIWFFVPRRPVTDDTLPPPPESIVKAWPMPLAAVPLYMRPDLVTLPSAASFGADVVMEDTLAGVPSYSRRTHRPLALPPSIPDARREEDRMAMLRTEAMRGIRRMSISAAKMPAGISGMFKLHRSGIDVILSSAFGDSTFVYEETLFGKLPTGRRGWEAELWIQFDGSGRPEQIFLERSTGDPEVDRDLVRILWHPGMWQHARGAGRVSVRYIPKTGKTDAHTNGILEAR